MLANLAQPEENNTNCHNRTNDFRVSGQSPSWFEAFVRIKHRQKARNRGAPKSLFPEQLQRDLACPVRNQKIFRFARRANHL
jgi:hypothetical protein